jgi:hypothetical protein
VLRRSRLAQVLRRGQPTPRREWRQRRGEAALPAEMPSEYAASRLALRGGFLCLGHRTSGRMSDGAGGRDVKVGMAVIFQNPGDARPDHDVYRDELRLADLAEPLGFDSIWSVEHHFTDYTMVPDVLQLLSYLAARTQRVQLGSMVVVLPWHDPLRVAEQVALLDNLSGGRVLFGIGRGAGRVEFEGFRVSMSESRERFVESAEMILRGLEKGFCEASGKFVQQTRKPLRPAPLRSFRGRTYAAAVSPESVRIMAELGRRHPHHPAEAMGDHGRGARGVPRAVPHAQRGRGASHDRGGLDLLRSRRGPRA